MNLSLLKIKKFFILLIAVSITVALFMTLPQMASALPHSIADALQERRLPFDDIVWLPLVSEPTKNESVSVSDTSLAESDTDDEASFEEYKNAVKAVNLCWYEAGEAPSLFTVNYSNYDIRLEKYLSRPMPFEISDISMPTVLIIHTHGSECYLGDGVSTYPDGETYRSFDPERGVVSAGRELARVLRENGIGVIHDETMHDTEDFNTSYVRSKKAVKDYLAKYPSIKCVIDLHRDSIFTSDGENQKPICNIGGTDSAQIMLVVGTDEMGTHPNWQSNLTFAVKLQDEMNSRYPTLARPVNIRSSPFNQSLSKGMLIAEIGSCGNTITEARAAAKMLGVCLASVLKNA